MTDMEKETVTDEILEETEQEAAEDMSQEQTDAQAAENQPDDKDVQMSVSYFIPLITNCIFHPRISNNIHL